MLNPTLPVNQSATLAKVMKMRLIVLLLLLTDGAHAQRITGLLMSELTRIPLAHATITAGGNTAQTSSNGLFSIVVGNQVDSIRIYYAGYKYYSFKPTVKSRADTLVVYLSPSTFALKEVAIRSTRNTKADSLHNRKEFSSVFAYKGRHLSDVMVNVDPYVYVPDDYITAHNSTASIVGFDVLRLISLFSKKDQTTHLQKQMLQDEANNYVDHQFSKQKVVAITALKGDSLQSFMVRFRPGIGQVKKMNDYELIAYIKKCYAEFVRSGETVHGP